MTWCLIFENLKENNRVLRDWEAPGKFPWEGKLARPWGWDRTLGTGQHLGGLRGGGHVTEKGRLKSPVESEGLHGMHM